MKIIIWPNYIVQTNVYNVDGKCAQPVVSEMLLSDL